MHYLLTHWLWCLAGCTLGGIRDKTQCAFHVTHDTAQGAGAGTIDALESSQACVVAGTTVVGVVSNVL